MESAFQGLPPALVRRVIGNSVETETLLKLGRSRARDVRLAELGKEALEVLEDARRYDINIQFNDPFTR